MLNINKKVVGSLEKCYSLAKLNYQGKEHFLCAAEKVNNCYLISLEGKIEETVWEGPGGVMTMVQVPGTDGQSSLQLGNFTHRTTPKKHLLSL